MNKLRAYIRLQKQSLRTQRIDETARLIKRALYAKCQNDLERSAAFEKANKEFEIELAQRKERQMSEMLNTEKAHDLMKLINLKYS